MTSNNNKKAITLLSKDGLKPLITIEIIEGKHITAVLNSVGGSVDTEKQFNLSMSDGLGMLFRTIESEYKHRWCSIQSPIIPDQHPLEALRCEQRYINDTDSSQNRLLLKPVV